MNTFIYFIFYIKNISFSTKEQILTEKKILKEKKIEENNKQIEENNNKERNSEQKNENITSENEIKKYKLIFNNIFNKINKKNIWFLFGFIFSGMSLFFILFFIYKRKKLEEIQKIEKEKETEEQILKKLKEKPIRTKTEEEIENLNFITNFIKNDDFKKNNTKSLYIELFIENVPYYFKIDKTKIDKFLENINTYFNSFEVHIFFKQKENENEIKEIYLFFKNMNFLNDLIFNKNIIYRRDIYINCTYNISSLEIEKKEQRKIIKNLIKEYCTQEVYR